MPWLKLLVSILAAVIILSARPVEIFLLALGVFLLAYFGISGFREFVAANQTACLTAVTVVMLAAAGVRLGAIGIFLAIVAIGVGAYIIVQNLHVTA